ncbi:DUF1761 domain-containing protein [Nonomuraea sediminis]|uniref:DUF1761 domain-containing protein n=1 Tax=Nonomuraea sediminis TaxID=2835864 RepID=UPI001BDD2024|nr:DUF1761 domain-containing protein [Nonomuraea sediminis]
MRVNYWAVGAAAVTTLVASAVYYIVFGGVWASLRGVAPAPPHAWELVAQLGRNVLEIVILAVLLNRLQAGTRRQAFGYALLIWLGFQAMMIAGSVLHEGYPIGLYLLHVGDALMTTLLATFILTLRFRRAGAAPGRAAVIDG